MVIAEATEMSSTYFKCTQACLSMARNLRFQKFVLEEKPFYRSNHRGSGPWMGKYKSDMVCVGAEIYHTCGAGAVVAAGTAVCSRAQLRVSRSLAGCLLTSPKTAKRSQGSSPSHSPVGVVGELQPRQQVGVGEELLLRQLLRSQGRREVEEVPMWQPEHNLGHRRKYVRHSGHLAGQSTPGSSVEVGCRTNVQPAVQRDERHTRCIKLTVEEAEDGHRAKKKRPCLFVQTPVEGRWLPLSASTCLSLQRHTRCQAKSEAKHVQ